MIYAIIGFLILIIGFLGFQLSKKQKIDKSALDKYKEEISAATKQWKETIELNAVEMEKCKAAREAREYEEERVEKLKQNANEALQLYHDTIDVRMSEIEASMEEQRQKRQEALDTDFDNRKRLMEMALNEIQADCEKQEKAFKDATNQIYLECSDKVSHYIVKTDEAKEKYESIYRVLRQYDADKQAKLFYTIQLPEEFQEDIEFLLTTVTAKVQHPDIISKLVWAEYVKPNLDDTFKRIEVKPEAGIYKLTSLANGKCYIGKSTNVKNRIADHFKSAVGIKSIADQAVHHAILKEGFWNWQIEIITYCDKDKLNELEKYYIEFFKAQEFGYNKTSGG